VGGLLSRPVLCLFRGEKAWMLSLQEFPEDKELGQLDRAMRDVEPAQALLTPYPADEMTAYPR